MAQRKKTASFADAAAVEAAARAELEREGMVKLAQIKPAALRSSVVDRLVADGFEVTKSVVRRPLLQQLKEALAHGALVPAKSLGSHVRGGSGTELKQLVEAAAKDGAVRRISRGTAEVLASPDVRVLTRQEVKAVREKLTGLVKALDKVTKSPSLSLLATDAAAVLSDALVEFTERPLSASTPGPSTEPSHEEAMLAVLEAVDAARDAGSGLSFVPSVVARLAPRWQPRHVADLLLGAAERELLELRPEGGIGRLSEAELSLCPPGPHGTRLSWARRLAGGEK